MDITDISSERKIFVCPTATETTSGKSGHNTTIKRKHHEKENIMNKLFSATASVFSVEPSNSSPTSRHGFRTKSTLET